MRTIQTSWASEHLFPSDVKQGVTGPMQVYGRDELSFEERLSVEREYIERPSFPRDFATARAHRRDP